MGLITCFTTGPINMHKIAGNIAWPNYVHVVTWEYFIK